MLSGVYFVVDLLDSEMTVVLGWLPDLVIMMLEAYVFAFLLLGGVLLVLFAIVWVGFSVAVMIGWVRVS